MAGQAPSAIRDEIVRLAHLGLDLAEFGRRAAGVLRRAVPFDGVAVVAFDPATALPTGEWADNALSGGAGARLLDIELREPDVNKFSELAASGRLAASMSQATGGNLDRSRRHRELKRPHGFGDELRSVCVGRSGTGERSRCTENSAPRASRHATSSCCGRCPGSSPKRSSA